MLSTPQYTMDWVSSGSSVTIGDGQMKEDSSENLKVVIHESVSQVNWTTKEDARRKTSMSSRTSPSVFSSTYAPTEQSDAHSRKSIDMDADDYTCLALKPTRTELNKVLGDDIHPPTTEISTIPCAGIRISFGRLTGLMAWRFVVQLDEPSPKFRHCPRPAIITNFILDTGSCHSPVPPETLKAIGYTGSLRPGTEVMLSIQGVRTKCVVAYPEEAGRLCGRFMVAGGLTLYFDERLGAPVLYVADDGRDRPPVTDIARTVSTISFKQRVMSLIYRGRLYSN